MFCGRGGDWDGAVKFKGLRVGWWRDGRFHGLFLKCGVKIPGRNFTSPPNTWLLELPQTLLYMDPLIFPYT